MLDLSETQQTALDQFMQSMGKIHKSDSSLVRQDIAELLQAETFDDDQLSMIIDQITAQKREGLKALLPEFKAFIEGLRQEQKAKIADFINRGPRRNYCYRS